MKIKRMTATFGKLDKAELCLKDGLNILQLPNEGGKSTWSAFLLAMLYGIDTSERVTKGTLPAKTRYKPWNGAAMEGRMELEWNGRDITIERRSKGRIPMGEFRAYETESGLPVRELTAENCGLMLIGAEKAVFERSAFLRQSGLRIDQTGALEQRLGALVSTGEETVAYSDTEKRLRDWKNAVRHNKTGELPRLERELEDTEETLQQIRMLQSSMLKLRAAEEVQTAETTKQERLMQGLQAAEQHRKREIVRQAEQSWRQKQSVADAAAQKSAGLPGAETLQQWQWEWTSLQAERRSIPVTPLAEPAYPALGAPFAGKTAEEIDSLIERDLQACAAYEQAAKPIRRPWPWAAILAAVAAMVLFCLPMWYLGVMALAAAGIFLAVWLRNRAAGERERKNAERALREIFHTYGADTAGEISLKAEAAKSELQCYDREYGLVMQERMRREEMAASVQRKETEYLNRLAWALPGFAGEPIPALQQALDCIRSVRQAEMEASAAKRQWEQLAATVDPAQPEICSEPIPEGVEPAAVRHNLMLAEQSLREIRSRMDRCQGQISAMGDPVVLEAQREHLLRQIADKQEQFEALSLAMEVLGAANDVLQTQFAPEISRRAADLMGQMTNGRYDRVLLDQSLSISARETGEVVSRDLIALSQGTGDQLYLSVRLAICEAVLPAETPMVLDDALVNFDDERAGQALALLKHMAEERQILLFTCHEREKTR